MDGNDAQSLHEVAASTSKQQTVQQHQQLQPVQQYCETAAVTAATDASHESGGTGMTSSLSASSDFCFGNDPCDTSFRITRKLYFCSQSKQYYDHRNLFLHMRKVHHRFICLYCLQMFGDTGTLAVHLLQLHKVVERLYEDDNGDVSKAIERLYKDLAEDSSFLVCCECDSMFDHSEDFYGHKCNETCQNTQQEHILEQQTEQNSEEKKQQILTGYSACEFCGLLGAHYPTCQRASSNNTALTALKDRSGAVVELSHPNGMHHPAALLPVLSGNVAVSDGHRRHHNQRKSKSSSFTLDVDCDNDYVIDAASFHQINNREIPSAVDTERQSPTQNSFLATALTKQSPKLDKTVSVLPVATITKKQCEPEKGQNGSSLNDESCLDPYGATTSKEDEIPKRRDSRTVSRAVKRVVSMSLVATDDMKKMKLDTGKETVAACKRSMPSPLAAESDSCSSHSQVSDQLHIDTQESCRCVTSGNKDVNDEENDQTTLPGDSPAKDIAAEDNAASSTAHKDTDMTESNTLAEASEKSGIFRCSSSESMSDSYVSFVNTSTGSEEEEESSFSSKVGMEEMSSGEERKFSSEV